MKAVLVTARWPIGGIRTFLSYVFSGFPALEVRLEFALPASAESRLLEQQLEGCAAQIHWLPSDTFGYVRALWRLCRSRSYDLVHAHGFTAMIAAQLVSPKSKRLVTVHDMLHEAQFKSVRGRVSWNVLRLLLLRADAVHAISDASAENLETVLQLPHEFRPRIKTVRNGIDSSLFQHAQPQDMRSALGIDDDVLLIGFFGRFMSPKGFRYLVDAVESMHTEGDREIHVVCVGSGGYKARELRDIQSRGIERYFEFIDFLPNVASIMKGVDLVVVPSIWETCPLIIMECLVSGVPLVASDIPAIRELADGSPATLIPPADGKAIFHVLSRFRRDEQTARAREFASIAAERFSVESTKEAIAEMYRDVLDITKIPA